eukprot:augustus_masked-scaffold_5-processed-gene-3.39-mRNA-1 protein AED:1.00 eAED:1.00 QI:0/0/0/0/1/1/2/0/634
MLSVNTEKFGEKLFSRGSIIDADFKPVATWTKEERNEYVKRAMRKYRLALKMKKDAVQLRADQLNNEISQMRNDFSSLTVLHQRIEEVVELKDVKWEAMYLLKQNEQLRKEILILKSERFILHKFCRVRQFFPMFELENFQYHLNQTVIQSFDLVQEVTITPKGKIQFFDKKLSSIPRRSKLKREMNDKIGLQKNKFGNLKISAIAIDRENAHILNYKANVKDEDYEQFTDTMYIVLKSNLFHEDLFNDKYDIEHNVADFDNGEVLFYCPPEIKNVHFDYQAVNLAVYRPKQSPSCFLMVTAIYRNSTFSIVLKSAMYFDTQKNSFATYSNGLTSCLVTRSKKDARNFSIKTCSTAIPKNRLDEILGFFRGSVTPKAKVVGLTIVELTTGSATFKWDVDGVEKNFVHSFEIQLGICEEKHAAKIVWKTASSSLTAKTCQKHNLVPLTQYYVRIRGFMRTSMKSYFTEYSDPVRFETLKSCPERIRNMMVKTKSLEKNTETDTCSISLFLTWKPDRFATSYHVRFEVYKEEKMLDEVYAYIKESKYSKSFQNLPCSAKIWARVKGENEIGQGSWNEPKELKLNEETVELNIRSRVSELLKLAEEAFPLSTCEFPASKLRREKGWTTHDMFPSCAV